MGGVRRRALTVFGPTQGHGLTPYPHHAHTFQTAWIRTPYTV